MIPKSIETRRQGDVKLRVDTLEDGSEVFWLQSGVGAIQLNKDQLNDAVKVMRSYSCFDMANSASFLGFVVLAYLFFVVVVFGG